MRITTALLALSLAGNAAWAAIALLHHATPQAQPDALDEMPVASPTTAEPAASTLAVAPTAPAVASRSAAPTRPGPPALSTTPPALGAVDTKARFAVAPSEPLERLETRIGRGATGDERDVLDRMLANSQRDAADELARMVAARRATDEALAHAGSELLRKLLDLKDARSRSRPDSREDREREQVALLDFVAGRDFEAAFRTGGYGPTLSEKDLGRDTALLADGAVLRLPPGEFELEGGWLAAPFEFRPFPRDVTIAGAGPAKTRIVMRRGATVTGPIINLTIRDADLDFERDRLLESNDPTWVRVVNCRIRSEIQGIPRRVGALWLDSCEIHGGWADRGRSYSPVVGRVDEALVRMTRCVITIRPPLDSRSIRAAVLEGCTLREQQPKSRLAGPSVRLVETVVQEATNQDEWNRITAREIPFLLEGEKDPRRR